MFYLVVYFCLSGCGISVIPEKYETIEACQQAGADWGSAGWRCVHAPKQDNRRCSNAGGVVICQ